MNPALEEARRRWPGAAFETINHDGQPIGPGAELRWGFVRGAQWQAGQPVEITDEMVERGARAAYEWWAENSTSARLGDGAPAEWDDLDRDDRALIIAQSRAVLEAALGQSTSDGVGHLQTTVHR